MTQEQYDALCSDLDNRLKADEDKLIAAGDTAGLERLDLRREWLFDGLDKAFDAGDYKAAKNVVLGKMLHDDGVMDDDDIYVAFS